MTSLLTEANLFPAKLREEQFEMHEHVFISGPRQNARYVKNEWVDDRKLVHSHMGGSVPHAHPHTGPSYYGHGKRKFSAKPKGEQLSYVALSEEETSFELVITDSALIHGKTPIGDTPVEALGFPAAERMMTGSRLKCIVRDERKKRA
jgi:hypothetical protein